MATLVSIFENYIFLYCRFIKMKKYVKKKKKNISGSHDKFLNR
jgi:hypothetical protein